MKTYYVTEGMLTNLYSMHDLIWCCIYDIQDGKCESVELMGETMDVNRLYDLLDEVETLQSKVHYKVTGKEYGRIKEISNARNMIRYNTCLSKGMSEDDASYAFF